MNRRRFVTSSAVASGAVLTTPGLALGQEGTPVASPAVEPDSGYLPVNGLEMYYEIHGEGKPLLLLHGAFGSVNTMFAELLPMFAQTRRVIGLEQQGHGHTADIDRPLTYTQMAEDTAVALDALGIESTDVFGYSDGGNVALGLAIAHPERVQRMAIAGANWNVEGMHPDAFESMKNLKAEDFPAEFRAMYESEAPNPEDFDMLVEKIIQLGVEFPGWDPADLSAIASPVLIMIGDSDIVIPEHAIELFRMLGGAVSGDNVGLPASQLAILPGTTHISLLFQTQLLFNLISPFVNEPTA